MWWELWLFVAVLRRDCCAASRSIPVYIRCNKLLLRCCIKVAPLSEVLDRGRWTRAVDTSMHAYIRHNIHSSIQIAVIVVLPKERKRAERQQGGPRARRFTGGERIYVRINSSSSNNNNH